MKRVFATPDAPRYSAEAAGPACDVPEGQPDGEALDAARLKVAADHLGLLVEQRGERVLGAEFERLNSDVALAADLGAALAAGRTITAAGRTAFVAELMILADGTRPASLVRGGRLLSPGQLGAFGGMFERFLPDAAGSIRATGRIARRGRHLGSGVLVPHFDSGEPVILTAAHVVEELGASLGHRCETALEIDFLGEVGTVGSDRHELGRLLAIGAGEVWCTDYAIFELGRSIDGVPPPKPLVVDADMCSLDPPAQVAVVSYPGRPGGATLTMWPDRAWHDVFKGAWHLKRVSPARSVAGAKEPLVHHDATTTSGSSGGALLSIGSGRLAGLHLGGRTGFNVALRASIPLRSALTWR